MFNMIIGGSMGDISVIVEGLAGVPDREYAASAADFFNACP